MKLLQSESIDMIDVERTSKLVNYLRYAYHLSAMRKNQVSLRRLRMGKRSGFSLFGSSNTANDDDDPRGGAYSKATRA